MFNTVEPYLNEAIVTEGYEAAYSDIYNKTQTHPPYEEGSMEFFAWYAGYNKALRERFGDIKIEMS